MKLSLRPFQPVAAFATLLVLCTFAVRLGAQSSQKPMEEAEVVALLKNGVPADHVDAAAREHGIAFQMTPETETELRNAGATDGLLRTLRELAPKAPPSAEEKPAEGGAPVLLIEVSPGGGDVYVDDEPSGTTSSAGRLKLSKLPPGKHKVRVSLKGYRDFEQSVELAADQTVVVSGTLEPPKPIPPAPAGAAPTPAEGVANPAPAQYSVAYYHGAVGITEGLLTVGNGIVEFRDPKGKNSFKIPVSDIKDARDRSDRYSFGTIWITVAGNKNYRFDIIGAGRMTKELTAALIDRVNKEKSAH